MLIRFIKRKMGLTLTELLVVVAIIAIIAVALIPAITLRTENARVATARQEVKELAVAEDACAISTGYYLPLQVLDDIKISNDPNDDSLNNEVDSIYLIDPFFVYITNTGTPQLPTQEELPSSNYDQYRIYTQWSGPYTSQVKTLLTYVPQAPERRDFPLDPWNIPYRFFSPIGIIGDSAEREESNLTSLSNDPGFSNGRVTLDLPNYSRGRWLIVSLGRNRKFDDPDSLTSDDIVHAFGLVVHETNYFVRRF